MNGEIWLRELLESYGLRELVIRQGPVKWLIKADNVKIGDVERSVVMDRDMASVQRMLRLPVVVRVQVVRPGIVEYENYEDLKAARNALYEELFEAGRACAKYLSDLCQDLRLEYRGRQTEVITDTTSLATWAYQRIGAYEDERLQKKKSSLTGAVRSVLSQAVMTSFTKWRKANYSEQLAVFTSNTILLRNDSWRLERTTNPVRWVVHFAVSSRKVAVKKGEGEKSEAVWHSVVVSTNKNTAVHATLRKMLSGEIKPCDAKLVWEKGNRCWAFRLVGMRPRPRAPSGSNIMAIRRGLMTPMYRLLASGQVYVVKGHAYIEQKRGLAARKTRMQEVEWERGSGNRQHGRKKRKAARGHLADREANVTKSFVRQVWGETLRLAKRHGVTTLVIEDFTTPIDRTFLDTLPAEMAWIMRRFPWAEFKSWGLWACKRVGIRVVEVSAAGRSHICPLCGDASPTNYVPALQQTHCANCDAKMPGVFAEAWNMMLRSEQLTDDKALRSVQRGWQKQMEHLSKKHKDDDENGPTSDGHEQEGVPPPHEPGPEDEPRISH